MKNKPLVTIGIPVYNEEKYLAETIESALNQTFKDIQIIISDNGSTDNSYEIAKKYASLDDRIVLNRQMENKSPYINFKYLLDNSESLYFMWLGAHDIIQPNHIENAVALFNNETVCVYSYAAHLQENIFEDKRIDDNIENSSFLLKKRIEIVCQNVYYGNAIYGIYRRDILQKSHLNINGGDLLTLFIASYYGSIKCLKEISYFFRVVRAKEESKEIQVRYVQYGFETDWEFQRIALPFYYIHSLFKISIFLERLGVARARVVDLHFHAVLGEFGHEIYHAGVTQVRHVFLEREAEHGNHRTEYRLA